MKRIVIFVLLVLTACVPAQAASLLGTQPAETETLPSVTSTSTTVPTATIDYQQTAAVAEATSAQAMRLMVAVTAEQDRRNFEQASWTVTAEAVALRQQSMTQQAAQFTATAYATSIPATQTRQAAIENARSTEIVMTIIAPTQIHAIAEAQTYAQYSDELQAADLVFKIVLAAFILALAMLLFVTSVSKIMVTRKPVEVVEEPHANAEAIPLAVDNKNENVLLRAEVPCTLDQLLELADGVINRRMTLAINQWEGSSVHKNIKMIRAFFVQHHFAKVLLGKGGELGIEPSGEQFLEDCLNLGSPPLPYQLAQ